jgi:hypothetical protein
MRILLLALALGGSLIVTTSSCKRGPEALEVVAAVRIAPVADAHPWVIAFLTELSLTRPAGVDARLEGITGGSGPGVPDPVFETQDREALAGILERYEQTHARPPELLPVWESVPASHDRPLAWRLHFIDQEAGFMLDGEASATLQHASPIVQVQLGAAQRQQLAVLTRGIVGHRMAVVIDDEVVMAPVVHGEIGGGVLQVRSNPGNRDPETAALALHARLTRGD